MLSSGAGEKKKKKEIIVPSAILFFRMHPSGGNANGKSKLKKEKVRFLFFNGPSFSISSRSGNQDSCNAKQGGFLSIACAKYLFRYCSLGNRPALLNEKSWGNSKKMGCLCRLLINSWGVHNIEDSISLANFDSKQLKTKGGIDVGAGVIKVGA